MARFREEKSKQYGERSKECRLQAARMQATPSSRKTKHEGCMPEGKVAPEHWVQCALGLPSGQVTSGPGRRTRADHTGGHPAER